MVKFPKSLQEEENLAVCTLNGECKSKNKLGFCKDIVGKCNQKANMFAQLDVEEGEYNLLTVLWLSPSEMSMFSMFIG